VTHVRWASVPDSRRCLKCKINTDAGVQPLGTLWPGTHTVSPPGHPGGCRCALLPADPPAEPALGKAAGPDGTRTRNDRSQASPLAHLAQPHGALPTELPAPPDSHVTKADKPWKHPDTSLSVADQVYAQMATDFPAKAIAWVKRAKWAGPKNVPVSAIEFQPSRWQAGHEPAKVERFRKKIERRQDAGKPVKPVILADRPDTKRGTHLYIVDGHHRALAFRELGGPVLAYVGIVDAEDVTTAMETHSSQRETTDPGASENARTAKGFTAGNLGDGSVHGLTPYDLQGQEVSALPVAAGLVVRAADTGRVLMLQRAISEDDPAGGHWEFPGGCLDPGESPLETAAREWAEETGRPLPDGVPGGMWASRNGVYHGFVYTIPSEDAIPVHEGRDQVINPDDPDGDQVEAIAWWDVSQLPGNPALRRELMGDLDLVLNALAAPAVTKGSAEVLREYWTREGHPGPTHWANEEEIRWGEGGDFMRCVAQLTPHIGAEGALGYCNLRHHERLGYWPAQHARMEGK
jgi:8-oxo-dGTP pyrophosphatase MutT (NUDIX family)